jgi:hypothetical protein
MREATPVPDRGLTPHRGGEHIEVPSMHPTTLLLLASEHEQTRDLALRAERRRALLASRDEEPLAGAVPPASSRRSRPAFRGLLHFLADRRPAADRAAG